MAGREDETLRDFRAVYRAHHGLVWHALHRLGVDSEAIEDAVQDVFVVAYRRRGDYEGTSTKAWLYGIARRVAANHRRASRRRVQRHGAIRHARGRPPTAGTFEVIHSLDRYLSRLHADDRELFILSELEGMTGPEIAEARGRKVQTVYTRIRKLRLDLRADLGDVEEIRKARPRASAAGWAALVPVLGQGQAAAATGWLALLGSKWVLGSAGVAAAVVITTVAVPRSDGSEAVSRPASVASSAQPNAASAPEHGPAQSGVTRTQGTVAQVGTEAETPGAGPTTSVAAESYEGPPSRPAEKSGPAGPPSKSPARAADRLSEENALLGDAADELRAGQAAKAIATTDEHARRFPGSPLADLRIALRIEALCQQGKPAQARGEAVTFLRRRPGSPMAERIEKSCAGLQENFAHPDKPGS